MRRKEHDTVHGTQPGDPVKAAEAILTAVTSPTPPKFLLLGQDALTFFNAVHDAERPEIDHWAELTTTTNY